MRACIEPENNGAKGDEGDEEEEEEEDEEEDEEEADDGEENDDDDKSRLISLLSKPFSIVNKFPFRSEQLR